MTRLVLIRHGESRVAVERIVGGMRGDTGLTELGRSQTTQLRDRLTASQELSPVDVLMSSLLPRAIETAEIIAPAFGMSAANVVHDPELHELSPGKADGLTWDEFGRVFGDPGMREHPYAPIAPEGESIAEFQLRVGRALSRVVADYDGQTIVIACHGGVIDASMTLFLSLPRFGTLSEFHTVNTSITEWWRETSSTLWKLVRYNDAAHLLEDRRYP
jgi:2,3-bisphosphoglycerate-dependent phosphoglycerate mutase